MAARWRWVAALVVVPILVASGCGDDDEESTGTGATTTAAAAASKEPFCGDVARIQQLEPDIAEDAPPEVRTRAQQDFFNNEFVPLLKKIQGEAPAGAKAEVDAIASYITSRGPSLFEDAPPADFVAVEENANTAAAQECGAEQNDVTAVDYAFQGAPSRLKAGYRLLRFKNAGKELHEMVLLRKKPATTESFDQILALEEEQATEKVDTTFANFAVPGGGDSTVVDLEPGEYAMVCFIPVGLTPDKAEASETGGPPPDGPPHFTRGMRVEFSVR